MCIIQITWALTDICVSYKDKQGGEVASRQAHNLKVGGSNPSPATKLSRLLMSHWELNELYV